MPPSPAVARAVDDLAQDLRRGRYDAVQARALAKRVAETLIATVATASSEASLDDIVRATREVGGALAVVKREHFLVGNVARRILRVIRDEGARAAADRANANAAGDGTTRTPEAMSKKLKGDVIDTAHEVTEEMEAAASNVAAQSGDFVTSGAVVMTTPSAGAGTGLTEAFLRDAMKKRGGEGFGVIVAEGAPRCDGHAMARSLAERGAKDVSVICDSAVYATMPNVKLCVLSAVGVLADGTALTRSGAYNIALAAKAHSVPVIVLAGSYVISPKSRDEDGFDRAVGLGSPATALGYGEKGADPDAVVINPALEYVPPELISVFVTDHGAHCPGFIKVLLDEMYSPLDVKLLDG